jgi:hypothetical protein
MDRMIFFILTILPSCYFFFLRGLHWSQMFLDKLADAGGRVVDVFVGVGGGEEPGLVGGGGNVDSLVEEGAEEEGEEVGVHFLQVFAACDFFEAEEEVEHGAGLLPAGVGVFLAEGILNGLGEPV